MFPLLSFAFKTWDHDLPQTNFCSALVTMGLCGKRIDGDLRQERIVGVGVDRACVYLVSCLHLSLSLLSVVSVCFMYAILLKTKSIVYCVDETMRFTQIQLLTFTNFVFYEKLNFSSILNFE